MATLLTIVVWIVVAMLAGLVAERLRQRLACAFTEIEAREEQLRVTLESADAAVGLFAGRELRCRNANRTAAPSVRREDWHDEPLDELLPGLDERRESPRARAPSAPSRMHHDEVTFPRQPAHVLACRCAARTTTASRCCS